MALSVVIDNTRSAIPCSWKIRITVLLREAPVCDPWRCSNPRRTSWYSQSLLIKYPMIAMNAWENRDVQQSRATDRKLPSGSLFSMIRCCCRTSLSRAARIFFAEGIWSGEFASLEYWRSSLNSGCSIVQNGRQDVVRNSRSLFWKLDLLNSVLPGARG